MIHILYYSPKTALPALLASIRHCRPGLPPEKAWAKAEEWLQGNRRCSGPLPFLECYGCSPEGNSVWLMVSDVPPRLFKRTLSHFAALLTAGGSAAWVLQEGPLPALTGGKAGFSKINVRWRELGAVVEQTRLKAELVRQR